MSSRYGGKIVTDGLVLCLDAHDAKSYAGEPVTNLVTSTAVDFSVLSGYTGNTFSQVADSESPSGYACEMSYTGTVNSSSRSRFGASTNIPSSGTGFVSVWVKHSGGTSTTMRPSVYTGYTWYILAPLDGGSDYITEEYRPFGVAVTFGTNSGGPNPGFSMTYAGNSTANDKTRWIKPQVTTLSYNTPFANLSRSATNGWVDRSGSSNSGTLTNMAGTGTSHYRDGQVIMPVASSYLEFDGTNDIVTISSPSFTTINTHSVCAWVNTDDVTGWRTIIDFDNDEWLLALNNKNFTTYDPTFYSGYYLTAGKWHHVCRTHESGGPVYLYLDGALVYTSTNVSVSKTFSKINIGAGLSVGSSTPNELWNGKIAQVQMYSRKLSTEEVLSNYNTTKGRYS